MTQKKTSRLQFLKHSALMADVGTTGVEQAVANTVDANLPPNIPAWMKKMGRGVITVPYGARLCTRLMSSGALYPG